MVNENNKLTYENQVAIQQVGSDKPTKKIYRGYLFALILLILLVGIIGGGYILWKELQANKARPATTVNNIQTQPELTSKSIAAIEKEIKKLQKKQSDQSDILTSLYRNTRGGNGNWVIAEIEYLLAIAMHKLMLEKDVALALAAMETADLKLRNLRSPRLLPVRKQLAANMNQLRAINHTDISGMAVYLAQMGELSAQLPLKLGMIKKENTAILSDENQLNDELDTEPLWKRFPRIFWQEIKSLVIIKRSDELRQAFLLPDEEYFLYQNLRMQLENARLSVLRADSENFSASIVLIQSWLRKYFDTNDSAVINIIETLDKMQIIELVPQLPDISASMENLRTYLRGVTSATVNTQNISKERNK